MSLKSLVKVVWNRLWLVALVAIVLGGASVGASLLQTPMYEASARILVGQDQSFTDSPSNTLGFQQLTQTMATAADSRRVFEPIIERFDLGLSTEEFEERFSASQVSATQFVEITYEDSDPQTARGVTNALAEEFSEQIAQISEGGEGESQISATVWAEADEPTDPVSPQPVRDGILALLAGGMLGVGIAFLLEFFDDSWGSPEEAERISGAPVFGIIPEFDLSGKPKKGDPSRDKPAKRAEEAAEAPGVAARASVAAIMEELGHRNGAGEAHWPVGVLVMDMKGRVKESNPKLRSMLGYSAEEIAGATVQSLASHPDDVGEHAKRQAEIAKRKRDHYQLEKRMIRKDGQLVWVRMTVSSAGAFEAGGGKLLVGMVEDISGQRQAKEQLRLAAESERLSGERLRRIADNSSLVVHYFTPDGHPLADSSGWSALWGGEAEEAGSNVFENPRIREAGLTPYIEKSISAKESVATPILELAGRNGQSNGSGGGRWIQASIEPLTDGGNRVVEVMVVVEDVTSRKRAEDRLGGAETDLQKLHEAIRERESERESEREDIEKDLAESRAAKARAEEELKETKERFKSLVEFATGVTGDREGV